VSGAVCGPAAIHPSSAGRRRWGGRSLSGAVLDPRRGGRSGASLPSEGADWSAARGEKVDPAVGGLVVRARVDVRGRHHHVSADSGRAARAVDVAAAGHPGWLRRRAASAAWAVASVVSGAAEAVIIQQSVLRGVRAVVAVVAGRGAQIRFSGTTAPRVPTTATGCAGTEAFISAPKA
jgi:hypothetical protein